MTNADPTSQADRELVEIAKDARAQAYVPYSDFRVGAALRMTTGEIFSGANVENASYGLTICAERVATFKAVTSGHTDFQTLALVTAGGHAPCGACRQVLAEFVSELTVLIVDVDRPREIRQVKLSDLLPLRFQLPDP